MLRDASGERQTERRLLQTVTILIPTKNNARTLDRCLDSIEKLAYPSDLVQVVIIDGFSTDETLAIANRHPVAVVQAHGNPAAAYNAVLDECSSEIVAFLDADAWAQPDWLNELVGAITKEQADAAGGMILTWNVQDRFPRAIGYELANRYSRMPQSLQRVATTNLAIKRNALQQVGRFDENLATGYDADIGVRLVATGHRIVFVPEAVVYHYHRSNLKDYVRQQFNYARNNVKLYWKHPRLILVDNVTTVFMVLEPIALGSAILLLLVSGVLALQGFFRMETLLVLLALGILSSIGIHHICFSIALSLENHDLRATPILFLVYSGRSVAWFFGLLAGLTRT